MTLCLFAIADVAVAGAIGGKSAALRSDHLINAIAGVVELVTFRMLEFSFIAAARRSLRPSTPRVADCVDSRHCIAHHLPRRSRAHLRSVVFFSAGVFRYLIVRAFRLSAS